MEEEGVYLRLCIHAAHIHTQLRHEASKHSHAHTHRNCKGIGAQSNPTLSHTHFGERGSRVAWVYLGRAAADWPDFVAERRHGDQQFVVLVEDSAAGCRVQTQ